MASRRWYGVALGTVAAGFALAVTEVGASDALFDGPFGGVYAAAILLSWPLVPLSIALDVRTLDDVPWQPSSRRWLLAAVIPLANAGVGLAYCVRRRAAVRGTVPSRGWHYAVVAGTLLWAVSFGAEIAVDHVALPTVEAVVFGPLLMALLVGFPVALYLDIARVRGYTDDAIPVGRFLVLGSIPYVAAVLGAAYLYRRRTAFREAADPTTVDLPDGAGDSADPDATGGPPTSPWYPRAAALFGVHLLLVVLLALAVPSAGETTLQVAAILLWLPFGPFFAACVYKDAGWRRENDVEVGDNWRLYLLAALVQAAAFWYVVQRGAKRAERTRRTRASGSDGSGEPS